MRLEPAHIRTLERPQACPHGVLLQYPEPAPGVSECPSCMRQAVNVFYTCFTFGHTADGREPALELAEATLWSCARCGNLYSETANHGRTFK